MQTKSQPAMKNINTVGALAGEMILEINALGKDEVDRPWYEFLESRAALVRMRNALSSLVSLNDKIDAANDRISEFMPLFSARHDIANLKSAGYKANEDYSKIHKNSQANRLYKLLATRLVAIGNTSRLPEDHKHVDDLLYPKNNVINANNQLTDDEILKNNVFKNIISIHDLLDLMKVIPQEKWKLLFDDISPEKLFALCLNGNITDEQLDQNVVAVYEIYKVYFDDGVILDLVHTKQELVGLFQIVPKEHRLDLFWQLSETATLEILQKSENSIADKDYLWHEFLILCNLSMPDLPNLLMTRDDLLTILQDQSEDIWLSILQNMPLEKLINLITKGQAKTYDECIQTPIEPTGKEIHDKIIQAALLEIYSKKRAAEPENQSLYGFPVNAGINMFTNALKPVVDLENYTHIPTRTEKVNAAKAVQAAIVKEKTMADVLRRIFDSNDELNKHQNLLLQANKGLLKIFNKVLKIANIDLDQFKNENVQTVEGQRHTP